MSGEPADSPSSDDVVHFDASLFLNRECAHQCCVGRVRNARSCWQARCCRACSYQRAWQWPAASARPLLGRPNNSSSVFLAAMQIRRADHRRRVPQPPPAGVTVSLQCAPWAQRFCGTNADSTLRAHDAWCYADIPGVTMRAWLPTAASLPRQPTTT